METDLLGVDAVVLFRGFVTSCGLHRTVWKYLWGDDKSYSRCTERDVLGVYEVILCCFCVRNGGLLEVSWREHNSYGRCKKRVLLRVYELTLLMGLVPISGSHTMLCGCVF